MLLTSEPSLQPPCYSFSKEPYERWVGGVSWIKGQWRAEGFKPQGHFKFWASSLSWSLCAHWKTCLRTIMGRELNMSLVLCYTRSQVHLFTQPQPTFQCSQAKALTARRRKGHEWFLEPESSFSVSSLRYFPCLRPPSSCSCQNIRPTQDLNM